MIEATSLQEAQQKKMQPVLTTQRECETQDKAGKHFLLLRRSELVFTGLVVKIASIGKRISDMAKNLFSHLKN